MKMQIAEDNVLKKTDYKILIVDDDEAITDLAKNVLDEDEYQCFTANSPQSALKILKDINPYLVISDIRMPGMTGVEMVGAILKIDPDIQCIFMTGFAAYEAVTQAINYHPVAYLEKPFDLNLLRESVEKAFLQRQSIIQEKLKKEKLEEEVTSQTKDLEFRTDRLMAEKELMHGIIAQANFGLIAVDSYYVIHMMNKFSLEVLELDTRFEDAFHGLSPNDIINNDIKDKIFDLFNTVLADGKLHEINSDHIQYKKLNIIAYPVVFKGNISAVVFIIHDITEKYELQKRLTQSAKLASIGELAAGVAHEINNPLGFVTSNINSLSKYITSLTKYGNSLIETIEKCSPSNDLTDPAKRTKEIKEEYDIDYITEDVTDLLNETKDGLARVSKIVLDLKTFARAEGDTPQKGQINDLLENALNLVRNEIKYNLTVEKEFEELPKIDCFPNQLVQVFTNIFINASHAVKKAGTLTIKTSNSNNEIRISIKDSGTGIPEKILPKIFDPFFTTKEPGKGTGMGLSISYSIIKKHQGVITAQSTVGEGTEFKIILPVGKQPISDKVEEEQMQV